MDLNEAYEEALGDDKCHAGRRNWIRDEMELYSKRVAIVAEVESRGGHVSMQRLEGLRPWVGEDFAQLKDKLIAIQLRGSSATDEALQCMIENYEVLGDLKMLDLADSQVTGECLSRLQGLESLSALDLQNAPVDNQVLELIRRLPNLERLRIDGTKVNWRGRMKLKLMRPGLNVS